MGSNIELKRAEFRKYLERSGVVEALTRALIALYSVEDKPEDPVAFVKNNLMEHDADANALLDELEGALHRVEELEQELMKLQEAAGLPPDINIPMTPESTSEQELGSSNVETSGKEVEEANNENVLEPETPNKEVESLADDKTNIVNKEIDNLKKTENKEETSDKKVEDEKASEEKVESVVEAVKTSEKEAESPIDAEKTPENEAESPAEPEKTPEKEAESLVEGEKISEKEIESPVEPGKTSEKVDKSQVESGKEVEPAVEAEKTSDKESDNKVKPQPEEHPAPQESDQNKTPETEQEKSAEDTNKQEKPAEDANKQEKPAEDTNEQEGKNTTAVYNVQIITPIMEPIPRKLEQNVLQSEQEAPRSELQTSEVVQEEPLPEQINIKEAQETSKDHNSKKPEDVTNQPPQNSSPAEITPAPAGSDEESSSNQITTVEPSAEETAKIDLDTKKNKKKNKKDKKKS